MTEDSRGRRESAPLKSWFAPIRAILFWAHFGIGAVVAIVVVIMGTSGAMMSFEQPIIDRVEARWAVTPPEGASVPLPPSKLLSTLEAKLPQGLSVVGLTTRADPNAPVLVTTKGGRQWLVDPYRGEVLGASRVRVVFATIEDVHRNIALALVGKLSLGKTFTGWTAVGVALLSLSGPFIWWPRKRGEGRFRRIAFFARTATAPARDFNWHNVIGIWTSPLLFIIAATGMCISFDGVKHFVTGMFGATQAIAEPPPESAKFDVDEAWAEAARRVPRWSAINGRWPAREGKFTLRIRTNDGTRPDEWNQLAYDVQTGAVASFSRYETAATGTKILGWARWTHTGQAFGFVGQGLAALTAGGAAVLAWTGVALAWRRVRRSLVRRSRASAASSAS